MADKIATREAYGNALAELGEKYDIVVLDADLSEATKTGTFKKKFPERFINCGIAEGNMMAVAAGIAATGKIPFASSFAMFAAGSAFDKVIKTTCFLANMEDFAAFNEVYAKYFVSKPARSCVAVKTLPKNVLCEVELIAVVEE